LNSINFSGAELFFQVKIFQLVFVPLENKRCDFISSNFVVNVYLIPTDFGYHFFQVCDSFFGLVEMVLGDAFNLLVATNFEVLRVQNTGFTVLSGF
jgi:hypothetical protein